MLLLRSKSTHGAEQSAAAPNPAFHTALRKVATPVGRTFAATSTVTGFRMDRSATMLSLQPSHQMVTAAAFCAQRKKLKGYEDGLAASVSLEKI